MRCAAHTHPHCEKLKPCCCCVCVRNVARCRSSRQTRNTDAQDTTREMETDEKSLLGSVCGNFSLKKLPGVNLDKSTVVCKLCKKEFAYHQSTSSLRYHLNAKHVAASTDNTPIFKMSALNSNNTFDGLDEPVRPTPGSRKRRLDKENHKKQQKKVRHSVAR
ncbi:putative BTB/POZ domain-containing protein KCTD1-like [Triplophysa rosa]|uniref:BTB/POZ domain-containing protein KCTD1-like n=1 Tax=Triplophysa rosa TaxID=992332 RepID=A0A9W7TX85_TRIRA|nr:putative BTB/POZ domain-containing protein KCTD1-like [Triplophysa rosa]